MSKKVFISETNDSGTIATGGTTKLFMTGSEQLSEWVSKPEDATVIDDVFWIKRQRWGTFISILKDGSQVITSLSEEECKTSTQWYLKAKQDDFPESTASYDSVVGGKL